MIRKTIALALARRRFSLDTLLEAADAHGRHLVDPVRPDPMAPPRTPFESPTPGLHPSLTTLGPRQRLRAARHMLPVLRRVRAGARMYDRAPRPTRHVIEASVLDDVVGRARALGMRDVGYVRIPRTSIFAGKQVPHEHAIVFTVEMDAEPLATSPSLEAQLEVMDGYGRLARIANSIAADLRAHGCSAYPGTALGGTTDYVQLAELAGLGAIGYHGLLIAPGEGARVRIAVVYTNVTNLPFDRPNPHAWVRDFCALCRKCVRACPVGAIEREPQARPAGYRSIDRGACRDYFTENYGCGVCLVVCPFSQAGYAAIEARFKGNPSAPTFEVVDGSRVRT